MLSRSALFVAAVIVLAGGSAFAQPPVRDPGPPVGGLPPAAGDPAQVFQQQHAAWKKMDSELEALAGRFRAAPPEQRDALKAEFVERAAQARKFMPVLMASAIAAYQAAPNKDPNAVETLIGVADDAVRRDDYEAAAPICDLLIKNRCEAPQLANLAGSTAYATDRFTDAVAYLENAKKAGSLNEMGAQFLQDAPEAARKFAREVEFRKAEATAQDLPVVRFETNKGPITIVLYENEAPKTVANFVSLVESGFYNGKTFHRVLPNFMAQGGCSKGDGTGDAGYKIPCECYQENHREHFRGTLSMAHAGKDTGGSQFFVTFLRTPHLDGRHTVFGRVVEGIDVLAKLQRRDPQRSNVPPDQITKATVLHKRQHEYLPTKMPE